MTLTDAQRRTLAEIEAAGVRVYNGRKRVVIEALVRHGLVTAEFDWVPHAKGSGIELSQRITVRPR